MENNNDILISQFIDNELDIDEKIAFVTEIIQTESFAGETLELLAQEKLMETIYAQEPPALPMTESPSKVLRLTFANTASLTALAASLFLIVKVFFLSSPVTISTTEMHRFVLHMPEAKNVSVAGTFSDWKNLQMQKVSDSGYWQITLPVSQGEHSYTFIVDDAKQISDPTVPTKQMDDFGGENSILTIGRRI